MEENFRLQLPQVIIACLVIILAAFVYVTQGSIPEWIQMLVLLVVGYFFGTTSTSFLYRNPPQQLINPSTRVHYTGNPKAYLQLLREEGLHIPQTLEELERKD